MTDGDSDTAQFDITVAAADLMPVAPAVADQTATVGTVYNQTLPVFTGGDGTLTYTAAPLPAGLTFNVSTRLISGTPTTVETTTVVYEAEDEDGDATSVEFDIAVGPADLLPTAAAIADQSATVGTAFNLTFDAATGGDAPLTYAVSGNPAWLTLSGRTLSGTPTAIGSHTITITVTDDDGDTDSASFVLAVAEAAVESTYITGSTLRLDSIDQLELVFDRGTNTGSNGGAWQIDLSGSTGSGGTGPAENSLGPYVYSETSGSDYGAVADVSTITILESVMSGWSGSGRQIVIRANIAGAGWTLNTEGLQIQGKSASDTEWSTIEIIEGWAYSDSYDFGDTISDSAGDDHSCIQIGGWVDFTIDVPNDHTEVRFRNLALDGPGSVWQHDLALWQIALQEGTAVDLTPAAPTIPDRTGTVGTAFSYTLPLATGGDDPVTTTADQLPAGLSLTSGVISGTPTAAGTTTVTITYTDDDGDTDAAAFDITVAAAPALAATANASLEVEFSATAPAILGDAPAQPSLAATANASFEVDFSAAASASLGDAPAHDPLAAVANASFEAEFSAEAPAALGDAAQTVSTQQFDISGISAGGWDGSILIDSEFVAGGGTAYLRRIRNVGGSIQVGLSATSGGDQSQSGPEFTDEVELYEEALVFSEDGGSAVTLKGPNHADNTFPDPSEPYFWTPDNSSAWSSWINGVGGGTVTLTITDGVSTAILPLAATANASFEIDLSAALAAFLGDAPALAATANASFEVDFSAAAAASLGDAPPLEATANASFEVDFSAAAPASLGDAPVHQPLAAVGNASFEVDFSAAAAASLGDAPVHQPLAAVAAASFEADFSAAAAAFLGDAPALAATANASFEVEFSAAAAASLGSAPAVLSFSDWATYAPTGRETRLLMLALRGTTHWYWPAQDSSGQLLDTSNSLYDDDLTDDLKINRIRWVSGDFTLNRSGAGSFDTYFEGATPPLDDGIWHIITDDGEITLGSDVLDDAGGGFARWMPTDSADIAFIDGIDAGDRFLLAFTMPDTAATPLEATANASFEVDFSATAPATLGDAPAQPALAATANASFEVHFSAAAAATLGDAPAPPALEAAATAYFRVDFSASARAFLRTVRPTVDPIVVLLSLQADTSEGLTRGYPDEILLSGEVVMDAWQPAEAQVETRTLRAFSDVEGPAIHGRTRSLVQEQIFLLLSDAELVEHTSRFLNAINGGHGRGWLRVQKQGDTNFWRSPVYGGSMQLDGDSFRYGRGRRRFRLTVIREPWFESTAAEADLGSHALRSRTPIVITGAEAGTLAAPMALSVATAGSATGCQSSLVPG